MLDEISKGYLEPIFFSSPQVALACKVYFGNGIFHLFDRLVGERSDILARHRAFDLA